MENQQQSVQQSQDKSALDTTGAYQKLGKKTFWMFVFEMIQAPAALLVISILFFALRGASFVKTIPFANIDNYMTIAAWCSLGFCLITFLLVILINWFIYDSYTFSLSGDAFKIKRGVFTREEIAIPYRQIQDVDIEQDFSYRMLGVSRLVILTAGHGDEKTAGDEAEGILPAIDSALAERLQSELLPRANVQTVIEEK